MAHSARARCQSTRNSLFSTRKLRLKLVEVPPITDFCLDAEGQEGYGASCKEALQESIQRAIGERQVGEAKGALVAAAVL